MWIAVIVGAVASCAPSPPGPPNILFILTDDLGYADVGVYGGREVPTPNLDRLAGEGMRFSHFYTNGATCTPTRIGLLTGRYPQRFGFREGLRSASSRGVARSVVTLPGLLKGAGYDTMHVGKWHVGHAREEFRPLAKGYDGFFGFLHAWFLPQTYRRPMLQHDEEPAQRQSGHLSDLLTDEAIAFLKGRRPLDPPFFLSFWTFSPHVPFQPPRRWSRRFDASKSGRYGALVSALDENIGRLLDALAEADLAEDTVVIFASDNGGVGLPFLERGANGPLRGVKNFFSEGGIRAPLIVRWPGRIAAGAVSDELVMSHDWLATLVEIAGVKLPQEVEDSRSIAGLLQGDVAPGFDGPLFWEDHHETDYRFAVRDKGWKLLVSEGRASLFNLAEDPGESRDLAAEHPDVVAKMIDTYRGWRLQTAEIAYEVHGVEGGARFAQGDLTLDGDGGSARVRDQAMLDPGDGEFTFVASLCSAARSGPGVIARKGDAWDLRLTAARTLRLEAGGRVLEGRTAVPAEGCTQVAFSYLHLGLSLESTDGGQLRLYLDASLEAEAESVGALRPNDDDVTLGRSVSGADPFLGRLAGLRFFNTVLSAEELRGLDES